MISNLLNATWYKHLKDSAKHPSFSPRVVLNQSQNKFSIEVIPAARRARCIPTLPFIPAPRENIERAFVLVPDGKVNLEFRDRAERKDTAEEDGHGDF